MKSQKKRKTLKYYSELAKETVTVYLEVAAYQDNGRLYVALINAENDELYLDLTTNLARDLPDKTDAFISGLASSDNTLDFIENNNLAEPLGYAVPSGFSKYPVYSFDEERLKELDSEGYALFEKAYEELYFEFLKEDTD